MSAQELNNTVLKNSSALKAYYRFESDVVDTMGVSNGAATDITYTTGVYGNCAVFNGTSSKIVLPKNSSIQPTGSFSISFWIKTSVTSKDIYSARELSGNYSGVNINVNASGQVYFFVAANTGTGFPTNYYDVTNSLKVVNDNAWHHVAVVHTNGAAISVFVDGTVATRTYTAGVAYDASITPTIGFDGSAYFTGSLDEFAIFSTALSADQVKELYEGRIVGELWPQAGLVGLWHLSDVNDSSGVGYNFTNNGGVAFNVGKFGNAADFGETNTTKYLSNTANKNLNNIEHTVLLWIKLSTEISANSMQFFLHSNSTNQVTLYLRYEYNSGTRRLVCQRYRDGVGETNITSVNVTLGTTNWHLVGYTFNPSGTPTMDLYLDGNKTPSANNSSGNGVGNGWNGILVGSSVWGPTNTFYPTLCGKVDELAIFSRILTPQEIRRMYALGVGKLQ